MSVVDELMSKGYCFIFNLVYEKSWLSFLIINNIVVNIMSLTTLLGVAARERGVLRETGHGEADRFRLQ